MSILFKSTVSHLWKLFSKPVQAVGLSALLLCAMSVHAGGLEALQNFMKSVHSARGDFTQLVTQPPKNGEPSGRKARSSGRLAFSRPDKFAFIYERPYPQRIVSDGTSIWVTDPDLQQTTKSSAKQMLDGTPAGLLAANNFKEVERIFEMANEAEVDGLQWVRLKTRLKDSTIQQLRMGFATGTTSDLRRIEIVDAFGTITLMQINLKDVNVPMGQSVFTPTSSAIQF